MGNNWNENAAVAIGFILYGTIISMCGIFITIRLIHQLTRRKTKTVKSIQFLTIAATIIANIGICCLTLTVVTYYTATKFYSNYYQTIVRFCYFLSLLSIITVAAVRLRVTLHSTSYQYSATVYIIFWAGYIVLTIVGILISFGQSFLGHTLPYVLGAVGSIMYVFLNVYIIVLFVKILTNIADKLDDKEQSKQKAQLFRVMTKYSVLVVDPSLVSLFSSIVILQYAFASNITLFMNAAYFIMLTGDFLINIICLTLQFEFNEWIYFKYCAKYHDCTVDIVFKTSGKNNINRTNDDHDNFAIKRMVSSPTKQQELATTEIVIVNESFVTE